MTISLNLLISIGTLLVGFTVAFAYVKRQSEVSAKDVSRLFQSVDKHNTELAIHTEELAGVRRELDKMLLTQAEQAKSFVKIETTLAQIQTSLDYIKDSIPKPRMTNGTRANDNANETYERWGKD